MSVDEDNLDVIITSLVEKSNTNSIQDQEIRRLHICAQGIKLVDVPDPTPKDTHQTKKALPMDDELGTEITVERREQIYYKLISDEAKL